MKKGLIITGIIIIILVISITIYKYNLAKQGFGTSIFYKPKGKLTKKQIEEGKTGPGGQPLRK